MNDWRTKEMKSVYRKGMFYLRMCWVAEMMNDSDLAEQWYEKAKEQNRMFHELIRLR